LTRTRYLHAPEKTLLEGRVFTHYASHVYVTVAILTAPARVGEPHVAAASPRSTGDQELSTEQNVRQVLSNVLNLGDRVNRFDASTPLLGAVPELDSMAVVSLLTALEEKFGFSIEDDEVDGSTFTTMGNLVAFVESKLAA
jgi:acyl carrier protein